MAAFQDRCLAFSDMNSDRKRNPANHTHHFRPTFDQGTSLVGMHVIHKGEERIVHEIGVCRSHTVEQHYVAFLRSPGKAPTANFSLYEDKSFVECDTALLNQRKQLCQTITQIKAYGVTGETLKAMAMARNALANFSTEAGDFQQLHWLTINLARQSSNHLEEIELLQKYDVLHPCAQAKQSLHQAYLRYARESELPVSTPDPHTHDLFHPRTLKYLNLYLTKQDALENSPRSFGIKWTIVSPRLNPITLPYLIAQSVARALSKLSSSSWPSGGG